MSTNILEWANEHTEWANKFLTATQDHIRLVEKKLKTLSVASVIGIMSTFVVAVSALVIAKRN